MKKVLFTIQMIALVAMFPVYLVTELSHKTGSLTVSKPPVELVNRPEENKPQPVLNSGTDELLSSIMKMNVYYLNQ